MGFAISTVTGLLMVFEYELICHTIGLATFALLSFCGSNFAHQ
jgi:hypothetical protein